MLPLYFISRLMERINSQVKKATAAMSRIA